MYNFIISLVGILFCNIICIRCYKLISNYKNNLVNILNIILIIIFSIAVYYNNQYNHTPSRLIINFLIIYILLLIVFKEKFAITLIKTITIYFLLCFFEILLMFSIAISNEINLAEYDLQYFVKTLYSINVSLFTLLFFEINKIRRVIIKLYKILLNDNSKLIKSIIYILIFIIVILIFNASIKLSITIYITHILIFTISLLFVVILVVQYFKVKKSENKEKVLIECLSKYEKLIDIDRINKHELLNNLLILRSFENKNSIKYKETLNSMINEYESKNNKITTNLCNLPSGLKGLLYYKIHEISNQNININVYISPKVLIILEKLNAKVFMKLCKIIGILLDNAKEASEISKEKEIIIDIYKEKNNIIFYIENSTKENINISKIYNKNYSTKGKNRGLGLYILNNIIKNTPEFEINQNLNKNRFISILKIKNKKTLS